MLSEIQKSIYNDYLKALAKANNRAYKPRKDFSKIDEETSVSLYRLELFFAQFKHINPYNFFIASFKYRAVNFLTLGDFLKHSAVIAYSRYNKQKYDDFIDSEESLNNFVQGFKHIVAFCLENNLPTKSYRTSINNMYVPWVLIHLNEQKISFYHLHALDVSKEMLSTDYLELLFNDFDKMFQETKEKYNNSNKLKELGNKLREKIESN